MLDLGLLDFAARRARRRRGVLFGYLRRAARPAPPALSQHNETRFRHLTSLSADWFWETDAGAPHQLDLRRAGGRGVLRRHVDLRQAHLGDARRRGRAARAGGAARAPDAQLPFFDLEISRTDERGARQIHVVSGQSRLDAGGKFLGYRGVGRDITEQRRAEQRAVAGEGAPGARARAAATWPSGTTTSSRGQVYLGDGWAAFLGREPRAERDARRRARSSWCTARTGRRWPPR